MKVILPVAGKGTRLRPHTHTKPKSLITVAGKPVLGHILDRLKGLPVDELIFIVDENSEQIKDYVDKHYNFNARYTVQEERRGPAHAVYLAREFIDNKSDVLIVFNDCIFNADLSNLESLDADGAIWVHRVDDPKRFGIVVLEDGKITKLVEKPDDFISDLAMIGLYYFKNASVLFDCIGQMMERNLTVKGEFYLPEALELMIERGERIIAPQVEAWLDCGRPETLLGTNRFLLDHGCAREAEGFDSIVVPPVHIAPDAELVGSIVGPYVSVGSSTQIKSSIVRDSIISENAVVEMVLLDQSLVGDSAVIKGNFGKVNVGDSSEIVLT